MKRALRMLAPTAALLVIAACRPEPTQAPPPAQFRAAPLPPASTCVAGHDRVTTVSHAGTSGPASAVIADMDGDGRQDIVVIGQGGSSESPITIIFDPLHEATTWQSQQRRHHVHAAVGDVNGDGALDLAASICARNERQDLAVDIYLSERGPDGAPSLPAEPSIVLAGGCSPDVAFGDVDADGDLDLAVAALDYRRDDVSEQHVYLNENGRFSAGRRRTIQPEIQADALEFADIDSDGLLDLVFAATTPKWGWVSYGVQAKDRTLELGAQAKMLRHQRQGFVHTPALQLLPQYGWILVGHSDHLCEAGSEHCWAPMVVWDHRARSMLWESGASGMTGALAAADLDGDGMLDLLANRWTPPKRSPRAGPIEVYCGAGSSFADEPVHLPLGEVEGVISHAILFANLDPADEPRAQVYTWTPPQTTMSEAFSTITLPATVVPRIVSVERGGTPLEPGPGGYLHTPGSAWLTIDPPLRSDEQVTVTFITVWRPDVVIVDYRNDEEITIIQNMRRAGERDHVQ